MKFLWINTNKEQQKKTPEEVKKEAILRMGTRQLRKLFRLGIQFPIISVA